MEQRCGTCKHLKYSGDIPICEWYPPEQLKQQLPDTWHDSGGCPVLLTDGTRCHTWEVRGMSERVENLAVVESTLHKAIRDCGTQYQFATKHKLSPQYVSDVLNRRRAPGPSLLKALKIRKVITYEQLQ